MRRKDRQVTDLETIREILNSCKTCHLAMTDNGMPYVIPLSYGYEFDNEDSMIIFFHSAYEGRKMDILKYNNNVCFEISSEGEPIYTEKSPCNSGSYFSSIIGYGNVIFINDRDEKCNALSRIMERQAGVSISFSPEQADTVCVYKVIATEYTGKKKHYRQECFYRD